MEQQHIWSYYDIEKAYLDCIKNKEHSFGLRMFNENLSENLYNLLISLNNDTYEIGQSITFIVEKPVYREVFAANFADRIVHHLLINETLKYFEEFFHPNSYACRKGKGVLYGVESVYNQLKEISENYTKDVYVLKLDLKSFFMSINKELLAYLVNAFIENKYPDNKKKNFIKKLFKQIILHRPENNCIKVGNIKLRDKLEYGKSLFDRDGTSGLAIGNLTSQILANFFLTFLDNYITKDLGFKYYGRYVDDFVILSTDKEKLKIAVKKIEEFCENKLNIILHPKKRQIIHYSKGFKFIGTVIKKNQKHNITRTKNKLKDIIYNNPTPNINKAKDVMTKFNSYLGFLIHSHSFKYRRKMVKKFLYDCGWSKYFNTDKIFSKIIFNKESTEVLIKKTLDESFYL